MDRGLFSQCVRLFFLEAFRRIWGECCICTAVSIKISIREFWDFDLQGKTIGALLDAFSRYYRKNIDLKPDDICSTPV